MVLCGCSGGNRLVIDASTLAGVPVAPWPASDKGHFADFTVPNSVASAGMERVPPRRLALRLRGTWGTEVRGRSSPRVARCALAA
jgi:hypothetical protein